MSNSVAISIKNVSKYYKLYNSPKDRLKEALSFSGKTYHKKFYATQNLSLEIKRGEILGIVGKNGSGKSTLLKLITGVLQPDEGSIKINGKISALLELGSGFNPEFTGMQNIFFYGTILGFTKKEMEEKLDDIITFADIGEFIHQPLKTYSSGMKSRLGFAVAVHIDPEILILDEVLAVGDILFRRKCYAKMEEFFKGGKTIIYVSHDANSVKELCTRAVFLKEGEILLDSDPRTVSTYYEKYLFANDANKRKILSEIKKLQKQSENTQSENHINHEIKKHNKQIQTIIQDNDHQAYSIPDFKPQSTIIYDESQVKIYDIHIKDSNGKTINALEHGEKYFYCYKLKFFKKNINIGFGMQFKTEKGLQITSAGSLNFDQLIKTVQKNDIYMIEWEFVCLLTPGTYYTNAGITAEINHERKIINRIIDAMVFKVLPMKKTVYGLVSLQQKPTYSLLNKENI